MAGHGAEDIQAHVRTYMVVFASLAGLTLVTVGIAYLHLPIAQAVSLALVVATVKASLVALFFMHLIDEQKTIYWLLGLTVMFFVALMYLPSTWSETAVRVPTVWNQLPTEGNALHGSAGHGREHEGEHGGEGEDH